MTEAEQLADDILRASGSGLRHYTLPGTRKAIFDATQKGIDRAQAELLEALKQYIDWYGAAHEQGCPEDDTCDCKGKPINEAVNAAIAKATKGA